MKINLYRIYYQRDRHTPRVWAQFGGVTMTEAIARFRTELGPRPIISSIELIKPVS